MKPDTRYERRVGVITPNRQRYEADRAADWLDAVKRGVCPLCNEGPFVVVATHVNLKHGIDKFELRDMLGLDRTTKGLCDPSHAKLLSENANRLHVEGRIPKGGGSSGPHRHSRRRVLELADRPWTQRRPGCPIGRGNADGYKNHGCRCAVCTEAWAQAHLAYLRQHPEQRSRANERDIERGRAMGRRPRSELEMARRALHDAIRASLGAGNSVAKVASIHGVDRRTVYRIKSLAT